MNDLRNFKMPDGKKWYTENSIKKELVFKDSVKEMKNAKEIARLKKIANLPPFGDADKDSIPNIFDKRPFIKDKKSKWGFLK
jgi:hypothetical protein